MLRFYLIERRLGLDEFVFVLKKLAVCPQARRRVQGAR
jgi:hypothetical protein